MSALRVIFFESPMWLILLALAAELVALWLYGRLERPKRPYLFVVPALAAILLAVQWLVVTDHEALRAAARRLAAAVEAPDLDAFMSGVDEGFRVGETDKAGFRDRLYATLERVHVDGVRLWAFRITVAGDGATVDFRAAARVETSETGIREYLGDWRLSFVRRPGGWLLRSVEHLSSPGLGDMSIENLTGG